MSKNMFDQITDGRTDLVFDYVAAGHAATSADKGGVSLIRWCGYYGDVSAIKFLLANGESLQSLGENYEINGAAFQGHSRLCQFLIEQGADVNKTLPNTGESPLHSALCTTNRQANDLVIKVLLTNGANPNCVTKPSVETDALLLYCITKSETPSHIDATFGTEQTILIYLAP